jgi:hypothetical protein
MQEGRRSKEPCLAWFGRLHRLGLAKDGFLFTGGTAMGKLAQGKGMAKKETVRVRESGAGAVGKDEQSVQRYTYKRLNDAWRLAQKRVDRGHYSERQLRKLLGDLISTVKWLHWIQDCLAKKLEDTLAHEIPDCPNDLFDGLFSQKDQPEEEGSSFVYVASQTNEKGVYKIGVTESITNREKSS